jgi:glycosyltransferase involved in cell wall biosynthesis
MKDISIVIPVYNERKILLRSLERISTILKEAGSEYHFEIIVVDDGSTDGSDSIVTEYIRSHPEYSLIQFSRNFGKEAALSAGMYQAKGDAVITIDADMQQRPEHILTLISEWEKGNDIVVAVRKSHRGEKLYKRVGAYCFYKLMNIMSDIEIIPYSTDFRIMDRQVVAAFKELGERNRMTRTLIDWLGFKRASFFYESGLREGPASYSKFKLIQLALIGVVKNSLLPLKLVSYLGFVTLCMSTILGIIVAVEKYILRSGWGFAFSAADMMTIVIVFLISIMFMSLGILSLYIADIQTEVRQRPLYVIKQNRSLK